MKHVLKDKKNRNILEASLITQKTMDSNLQPYYGFMSYYKKRFEDISSIKLPTTDLQQKLQTSIEPSDLQQIKLGEYNSYSQYLNYDVLSEYTIKEKKCKRVSDPEQISETELDVDTQQTFQVSTEELYTSFVEHYYVLFFNTVCATKFISGEDNEATFLFANMMNENMDFSMKLLQGMFISCIDKDEIKEILANKILNLLQDYSYEDAYPYSQTMALAAIHVKSPIVQSAAIGLFSHWANEESLKMLSHMERPLTPWVEIKYEAVIKSLENALRKKN